MIHDKQLTDGVSLYTTRPAEIEYYTISTIPAYIREAHEPPTVSIIPEIQERFNKFFEIFKEYRELLRGYPPEMEWPHKKLPPVDQCIGPTIRATLQLVRKFNGPDITYEHNVGFVMNSGHADDQAWFDEFRIATEDLLFRTLTHEPDSFDRPSSQESSRVRRWAGSQQFEPIDDLLIIGTTRQQTDAIIDTVTREDDEMSIDSTRWTGSQPFSLSPLAEFTESDSSSDP